MEGVAMKNKTNCISFFSAEFPGIDLVLPANSVPQLLYFLLFCIDCKSLQQFWLVN